MFQLGVAYVIQADREREVANHLRDQQTLKASAQATNPEQPPKASFPTQQRDPVRARATVR